MKVGLVVTNDCNLGCSYCYSPRKKVTVDPEIAKAFIDDGYLKTPAEELFDVNVIGGEALLKAGLLEDLFTYTLERYESHPGGIEFSLTTNGTLVNTPRAIALFERFRSRLSVGVSIDGTKEAHDRNRIFHSGKGSWDQAVEGYRTLEAIGLKVLDVNATFGPDTAVDIQESLIFLSDLTQSNRLACNPVSEWIIDKNEALRLANQFFEVFKHNNRHHPGKRIDGLNCNFNALGHPSTPLSKEVNRSLAGYWCRVGQSNSATLGYDGGVYPCNRFQNNDTMRLGKRTQSGYVPTPDRTARLLELADQFEFFPDECQRCALKQMCAYCIAAAYKDAPTPESVRAWFALKHPCGWTYARYLAEYLNNRGLYAFY